MCKLCSCLVNRNSRQALFDLEQMQNGSTVTDSISVLPAYPYARTGDPEKGYRYLFNGDHFNSGIPYAFYRSIFGTSKGRMTGLIGFNKYVLNDFTVYGTGQKFATPGCFHCHAQVFDGELVIGLGNSYSKFQVDYSKYLKPGRAFMKLLYGKRSAALKNVDKFYDAGTVVAPLIILETQGPNPGHRIADVMASHRDPETLLFRADTTYFTISDAVVPTDIPPLWHLKRKNVLTYTGMAQGNGPKHAMISTILTLQDTTEAEKIYEMMKDIWAYLETIAPPKYPHPINDELAREGRLVFNTNCSHCHGKYGKDGYYPNKLIPGKIVGTDSMLIKYTLLYKGYENWYNRSWYSRSHEPAFTKAQDGYIAQPLDGIWITAPYFHNGSVPTLEGVLNSKTRPRYWKRDFSKQEYDYQKLGWKYKKLARPGGKKTYDTSIPGYGNYGHYFGDKLTNRQREALIEYLKTI